MQVCVHAFDLLYLNGEALVRKPLKERRRLLREHFKVVEGEFVFATSRDMSDIDDLQGQGHNAQNFLGDDFF